MDLSDERIDDHHAKENGALKTIELIARGPLGRLRTMALYSNPLAAARRDSDSHRWTSASVFLGVGVLAFLILASSASAAGVHLFKEAFGSSSQPSFTKPLSVTVDQATGNVLVVDGGANEVQSIKVTATSGQFKLMFGGQTTADISFNATAATVKTALENLSSVGVKVPSSVAVAGGPGSGTGSTPYTITFQNQLGGRDVEQISASDGTTPLSGGSPSSEAVVTTTITGVASGIRRFNSDGTAASFSALGSNMIDGQRGPGGKTRAECEVTPEPASCDETPLNGFVFGAFQEVQITVDSSGGPTNGNIYVAQAPNPRKLVYVFGASGAYLGQITAAGATPFGEICGVAAASNGNLLVGQFGPRLVHKFVPSASLPLNTDFSSDFTVPSSPGSPCNVAVNAAGSVFAAKTAANPIVKFDSAGTFQYSFGSGRIIAVNPATGNPIVAGANAVATEYDTSSSTSATETATLTAGSTIQGIAAYGATGAIYVVRSGSSNLDVFGPVLFPPIVTAFAASDVNPTKAALNGAVGPQGDTVTECKFEYGLTSSYGQSRPCEESIPADANEYPVTAGLTGLMPNGAIYHYRLVAKNGAGVSVTADRTFTTASTVTTEAVTGVTDSLAVLHGSLLPEGTPFTDCKFEYGPTAAYGFSESCQPSVGTIEGDFQVHAVSASLAGLNQNQTYHVRLVATSANGASQGQDLTFVTLGKPLVSEQLPISVDKTSATLQAKINPRGIDTRYRFEWGSTTEYGNSTPADFEPFVGSGTNPVTISAKLTNLKEATAYHFRVVATNSAGETSARDQSFETLNSCGLIQGRCFELVSPADKGPVGEAGQIVGAISQMAYQVSKAGSKVAYILAYGLPNSTSGGEVLYQSDWTSAGWQSSQLSPLADEQSVILGATNIHSRHIFLSEELNCGFVVSSDRLTADPAADAVIVAGGANLYRQDLDGGYTLVTSLPPTNPGASDKGPFTAYSLNGASSDCSRIVFRTGYKYPGIDYSGAVAGGATGLYEWDEGTLRNVGEVPGPGGPEVATPATPGAEGNGSDWNAVSEDASRVFFTAKSRLGGDAGRDAIFLREDGVASVDVSQSQGPVPAKGARYQIASEEGDQVVFLANYGLTTSPDSGWPGGCDVNSGEGCALYQYSVVDGQLTELSTDSNAADGKGPSVVAVLDASDDGSYVYYAAQGQLVEGKGNTYSQNVAGAGAYNLYLAHTDLTSHAVTTSYVATVSKADLSSRVTGLPVSFPGDVAPYWHSRATPDGRHLLFVSEANVTGYESGGVAEAYLYSVQSEETVCVSCRRDGKMSTGVPGSNGSSPVASKQITNPTYAPVSITDDGRRVFFKMPDALAQGSVDGEENLYEWHDGQISLLATGIPGVVYQPEFLGASSNGDSVFFRTKRPLVAQDTDGRQDIYVARIGGGFAPPGLPSPVCEPLIEGSCQQTATMSGEPSGALPSSLINGAGNVKPKRHKKVKRHKKRHVVKHHRKRTNSHKRAASPDRRTAK